MVKTFKNLIECLVSFECLDSKDMLRHRLFENRSWQEKEKKSKHGGLDSRDQSRSRSRTSLASRPVFKTCQDFLDGRDQLLFYLGQDFLNRDFSIETWLCRDFYRDRRDKSRLSRFLRFVETFRDLSRYLDII